MEFVIRAVLMGMAATALIDIWALVLRRISGVASLDYALVGRWLGHMPAGRFFHARIAAAPRIRGERLMGWGAHYAIGVLFAAMLLGACGPGWARQPSPGPALAFGILTVAAPFFIMQPGMGLGIAASKTPKPALSRLRSLATHATFGLGLYASACALAWLMPR
ncbi:MAG: DUF2938 domain-containing protein [Xanthobacteraceae bacterium]|nr:DUF2938 domain-containing protein [Xanthobacteraceae bacterium]